MIASVVPVRVKEMTAARYLSRAWPLLPSYAIRDAFSKKDVKVNGTRALPDTPVRGGDRLEVYLPARQEPAPLDVRFEDERLLVFLKPVGLPADVDQDGIGEDTVKTRLVRHCASARPVHRLDTGTGGVMLAAKTDESEAALRAAFAGHRVEKHYRTLALGRLPRRNDTLKGYLLKNARDARARVVDNPLPGALPIETRYEVLRVRTAAGLVVSELDVMIPTGRTHQIRAHMSHIGHPLVGDDKYGDRNANRRLSAAGICLWCQSLEIRDEKSFPEHAGRCFCADAPNWRVHALNGEDE